MRIVNKQVKEYYTGNINIVQRGVRQFGPRELCADTICNQCDSTQSNYKLCKQKCFDEKENEINACCSNICSTENCKEVCTQRLF